MWDQKDLGEAEIDVWYDFLAFLISLTIEFLTNGNIASHVENLRERPD